MKGTSTLSIFFLSVLLLGVAHRLALELSLYWIYSWLDIPMHILGGFAVGFGIFLLHEHGIGVKARHVALFPLLTLVLIVGLSWEVFEIWAGIPLLEDDFEIDMASDLIMAIVGGSLAWNVKRIMNQSA